MKSKSKKLMIVLLCIALAMTFSFTGSALQWKILHRRKMPRQRELIRDRYRRVRPAPPIREGRNPHQPIQRIRKPLKKNQFECED